MEDIVEEVRSLSTQGIKEFQLIAQDLTYYGKDLYKEYKIAELVDRLADISGVEWIRLHYAYPNQFPIDLLPVMRRHPNVCKYLDIALQHSSNRMLQKMRRNITKEETTSLLQKIREEVPGIFLRTTMMVGHPDETDVDFEDLLDFAKDNRFERLGAFAYSEEEGTYSAIHYTDNVDAATKQDRLDELMSIQQNITEDIQAGLTGKTLKVIIDRKEDDYYIGRTQYDSPEVDCEVLIRKNYHLNISEFYNIHITGTQGFDLIGEPIL
jgi:ribosomal protein S12 methylthiotransferase